MSYQIFPLRSGVVTRHWASAFVFAIGAVALGGSISAEPALAQGQSGNMALEEIVVTAQFREQNLQQTPVAITAVNSEMMEARSQTSIDEVSAQAPNVTLNPNAAAYGPSLQAHIRGVGQYDFNPAYEPGVGLYVDDVYYATLTGSVLDLLDLDRVEILRGPQGTLAGKNSIGGAIKLYSRKPEGGFSGNAAATYGSRDRIDLRASVDFTVAENLFARLSGVSKQQDGYVDRIDYGCAFPESGIPALRAPPASGDCVWAKEGEVDYDAMRAMLRYDEGPLEVLLIGDFTHEDRTQSASVLTHANYTGGNDIDPFDSGVPLDDRFVPPEGSYYNYAGFTAMADDDLGLPTRIAMGEAFYKGWGVSGQVNWDLASDMTLTSITAYRAYDSGFSNDNDASPLAHSFGDGTLDFWSVSQEVRLNGTLGPNNVIEYTLGGFFMDQQSQYASLQDLRYAGLPPFWQDDPVNADSRAGFGHVNWFVTDALTLTGGLRYTDESKDYTFLRVTPDGGAHPVLGPLDGQTGEYTGDQLDYRLSVQYQWTENIMTYAQTATGFKGGGINPRPFFPSQVQPFGQEKLTSYELGAKTELFDRRLRLNGALFYSDYNDIQLTANACPDFTPTPSGAPCAMPINAGDAEMKGAELETNFRMGGWVIDGSLSYIDFDYKSVNPLAATIDLTDVPPYTPKWKWSAGIQYDIAVQDFGTITPRFDISYRDNVFSNPANSPYGEIESYYLANARLTWRSPNESWEASFQVTNLFDKYHFLTKFDQVNNNGVASGQPGRPREWALTIKRNF